MKKDFIIMVLFMVSIIVLLNINSVIIEPSYRVIFRATYLLIIVILIIYFSLKKNRNGLISKTLSPIIDKFNQFPRNYQIFMVVSFITIMLILYVLAVVGLIYVY